MGVRIIEKTVTLTAPAGQFQEFYVEPRDRYTQGRVIAMEVAAPAPVGATTGTHRVQIGLQADSAAKVTFAQADVAFGEAIGIYGSRPTQEPITEGTFPDTEAAFADAISRLHFSTAQPIWMRYTNLTDAPAGGSLNVRIAYVI